MFIASAGKWVKLNTRGQGKNNNKTEWGADGVAAKKEEGPKKEKEPEDSLCTPCVSRPISIAHDLTDNNVFLETKRSCATGIRASTVEFPSF